MNFKDCNSGMRKQKQWLHHNNGFNDKQLLQMKEYSKSTLLTLPFTLFEQRMKSGFPPVTILGITPRIHMHLLVKTSMKHLWKCRHHYTLCQLLLMDADQIPTVNHIHFDGHGITVCIQHSSLSHQGSVRLYQLLYGKTIPVSITTQLIIIIAINFFLQRFGNNSLGIWQI